MNKIRHAGLMLAAAGAIVTAPLTSAAPAAADASPVTFHAWNGIGFLAGQFDNGIQLTASEGRLALGLHPGSQTGTWTSPAYHSPAPIGDLVSSWQATTPAGSWVETRLSVRIGGHWSQWYQMGQWASDTSTIQRTSINDQSDADGTIYTDTYVAGDNGQPTAYRLREVLHATGSARPLAYHVAATTSNLANAPATSATTMTQTVDLPVPQYSQEIHAGEYPAYGGGGEVWCSPTSTAMVMAYWHKGPSAADLATLPADPAFDSHGRPDPQVDWAAIHTWDVGYEGTGNWPFNTGYASSYGLDGSVRQYTSLRDIESWIKRGVPIVASIAWNNTDANPDNDLAGAPIAKTGGHLMVVRGFTATGDVIAGDPAAPTNSSVRRVYQRSQFERDWLNASTGTTYVIKPLNESQL